jgi:hypothetical protein
LLGGSGADCPNAIRFYRKARLLHGVRGARLDQEIARSLPRCRQP